MSQKAIRRCWTAGIVLAISVVIVIGIIFSGTSVYASGGADTSSTGCGGGGGGVCNPTPCP